MAPSVTEMSPGFLAALYIARIGGSAAKAEFLTRYQSGEFDGVREAISAARTLAGDNS